MNNNKQQGETTMNESYKDKFNATMKQFGIDSLDDLKSDEEKKKFFKAVDKSHDAKNEELLAFAEEAINEFKLKDSDVEKLKQGVKQMPPLKGAKLGKPVKAGYSEEEIKEYTGMGNLPKSVNSNDVATALKNLKKGTKLHVQGKSQGGMRTSGSVVSVSGDTVKIKPTASNGPTSVKVKDITMMDTLKEESTNKRYLQTKPGSIEEAVLISRGLVKDTLEG